MAKLFIYQLKLPFRLQYGIDTFVGRAVNLSSDQSLSLLHYRTEQVRGSIPEAQLTFVVLCLLECVI